MSSLRRSLADKARHHLFNPILAGATARERALACLGALVGICLAGLISGALAGFDLGLPLIVAPLGASAVLLFAVPSSPLAQPWPIIGGNTISALVGITVAHFVHEPALAIGLAVALAIGAMSLTRSLHPPGGAAALTAVVGGPAVAAAGFSFALVPVLLNSVLLVALGLAFHRLRGRAYPHRPQPAAVNTHGTADPPPLARVGFRPEDVDAALTALDETFDIDRDDVDRLLRQVELEALRRTTGDVPCSAVMSRDVVAVGVEARCGEASALLLAHNLRTLPVLDGAGRLAGAIGLREIAGGADFVRDAMTAAVTAEPGDPVIGLVPALTDGTTRAVVIVENDGSVAGLVTQTDILSLLARTAVLQSPGAGGATA
ncbi:CBS domain-containing membrane protein [Kaistia hirudinis]|uniref:CBS domain-containing membrane protein n=1 Tax=Kaistia hirudinis TaxID=1293440 RepID=A0A840AID0_9HYPH|nr:HPP family protein [Kaistia hirudinis]MBB3930109.1 CBS domain-containing membrane protein [Kaistia hirudinis]